VNRKVGFTLKTGSHGLSLGAAREIPVGSNSGNETTNAYSGTLGQTISNSPITPETSSSWKIFAFLLAVGILSALMYFFFFYR
jgi:hypothetical protein